MARVLVVEDSRTQAEEIRFILEDAGFDVTVAANGRLGLAAVAAHAPDVVLTDLDMPEMDGLELVAAVRAKHPFTPVVLMTANGSEAIAMRALRAGAASYVPKRDMAAGIAGTLSQILEVSGDNRQQHRLLECLTEAESAFVLDNDTSLIAPLNGHVRDMLMRLKLDDGTGLIRIGIALHEAVSNAIHHGNLQLSSDLRQGDDERAFYEEVARRRKQAQYRDRRVFVGAKVTRAAAVFTVRDQGPGFPHAEHDGAANPAHLERIGGRGLILIKSFMDEVRYNAAGNEITMVKRYAR